jgi:prophage antirepressor-like protein
MSNLAVFQFDSQSIRFIDGKPIANDVATVLGYKDPANAISRKIKDKNKGVCKMQTPGGIQSVTVLEEPGIYQLIFGSKLPCAEKFQDWVFEEVLPTIRKTGQYAIAHQIPKTYSQALLEAAKLA